MVPYRLENQCGKQGILEIIQAQLYLHVYPLQAVIEALIFQI
jgi:hypothetical protein